MARKITGLYEKDGIWYINKVYKGERIHQSTGTSERAEAEDYLIHLLNQKRQEKVFGVRQIRTWEEAATKFLLEFKDQPSIWMTAIYLEQAHPFIGQLPLTHINDETLKPFVKYMREGGLLPDGERKKKPSSNRTINIALQRIVRILHLCNRKWRDDQMRPWLDTVPLITMMDEKKTRRAEHPLSWDEQRLLFQELPPHLERMALFKVNTGCREQEVCKLRWEWEVDVPELNTSVFIIPSHFGGRTKQSGVKNREDRVVILNDVAKSIIEQQRLLLKDKDHQGKELVFPYEGRALHRMNDSAWRSARLRAAERWQEEMGTPPHPGFAQVRIHDLKHTFGRRLKAADVDFEHRQVLLGHTTGSVTTHYSGSELAALIEAANRVTNTNKTTPTLTILRRRVA